MEAGNNDVVDLLTSSDDDSQIFVYNGTEMVLVPNNRRAIEAARRGGNAANASSSDGEMEEEESEDEYIVYEFVLEGPPQAWSRPKPYVKGFKSNPVKYFLNVVNKNKGKTQYIQTQVREQLATNYNLHQFQGTVFGNDAVVMDMEFYRKLPNTAFVSNNRERPLKPGLVISQNEPEPLKPDLDNYVKLIQDSLQGIMYDDDKQVVKTTAWKMKDVEPPHNGRTILRIRRFDHQDFPVPHNRASRAPTSENSNCRLV
jgi:Holliday junction resolvase RusA-like endonuclease